MIDHTKTTPEKLAEMNDSLIVDNNYLRDRLREGVAEIKRLRHSLAKILDDSRTFCDNVEIHKIANAALAEFKEQAVLNKRGELNAPTRRVA